jgi:hypothetical protein
MDELVIVFVSRPLNPWVVKESEEPRKLRKRYWEEDWVNICSPEEDDRAARGGDAWILSPRGRHSVLARTLLRILEAIYVTNEQLCRTIIVNSGILPLEALDLAHPAMLPPPADAGPSSFEVLAHPDLPKFDYQTLCELDYAPPPMASLSQACETVAASRGQREVVFRTMEEHEREVGFEQFMLETDAEFVLQ